MRAYYWIFTFGVPRYIRLCILYVHLYFLQLSGVIEKPIAETIIAPAVSFKALTLPATIEIVAGNGASRLVKLAGFSVAPTAIEVGVVALAELIERMVVALPLEQDKLVSASLSECLTKKQATIFSLEGTQKYYKNELLNYTWSWLPMREYGEEKQVSTLVPMQLLFLNPTTWINERTIVPASSVGTAVHTDAQKAELSAVLELVERDAFMFTWYAGLSPLQIKNDTLPLEFRRIIEHLSSKGIKVLLFDITHEVPIPTFCAVTIDVQSSRVQAGAATGANIDVSLRKVLYEALRTLLPSDSMEQTIYGNIVPETPYERMQYWNLEENISGLEVFTAGAHKSYTYFQKLYEEISVLESLKSTKTRFFTTDISTKRSLDYGLRTYRSFSPDLIPMVQDERWIRKNLQSKVQIPHPFV